MNKANNKFRYKGLILIASIVIAILPQNAVSQVFGNALEFDGVDDFIFVGNDTSLQVDQFTLSAWIHPYSYSEPIPDEQRMEIFEKAGEYWMNISSSNAGYQRDKGELRVGGIFEGQWHFLDSEFIIPLNEWTHVACTYDSDSLTIYINGNYEIAKAIPQNHTDKLDTDNMLALGCKNVGGPTAPIEAQFHGILDEMSIWNLALSQEAIIDIKNTGIRDSHENLSELRAYYKLDEDKIGEHIGTVHDEFGLNNGDNYGAVWVATTLSDSHFERHLTGAHTLLQNYPNPFHSTTYIPFELSEQANVSLDIYDFSGRHCQSLIDTEFPIGKHSIEWNVGDLDAGIYLYKLRVGENYYMKKCILQ